MNELPFFIRVRHANPLHDVIREYGVVFGPATAGRVTRQCPFADHPPRVDTSKQVLSSLGRTDRIGATKPLWVDAFQVNPAHGTYHCFGCGEHGSVIDFVMRMEDVSYQQAVQVLATRAGMPLEAS